MLVSDLIKVMPILKTYGFYITWINGKPWETRWYSYLEFANKYDFKKIQVIECKRHFTYSEEFDFELILRKATEV